MQLSAFGLYHCDDDGVVETIARVCESVCIVFVPKIAKFDFQASTNQIRLRARKELKSHIFNLHQQSHTKHYLQRYIPSRHFT